MCPWNRSRAVVTTADATSRTAGAGSAAAADTRRWPALVVMLLAAFMDVPGDPGRPGRQLRGDPAGRRGGRAGARPAAGHRRAPCRHPGTQAPVPARVTGLTAASA